MGVANNAAIPAQGEMKRDPNGPMALRCGARDATATCPSCHDSLASKPTAMSKSLASRSLNAVLWGAGGAALRIVLQFGCQVALARMLGAEQYGLFAIGAIVVGFSNFFADVGIAYGLIQKKEVTESDLRFVATWQFLIGSLVSASMYLVADLVATFFGDARARDVVAALAIICLINALSAPALNMLKRDLDFRRIQQVQLLGYAAGYLVVGIPLAWAGAGVWALVVAWIVQASCSLVLAYGFRPHPIRPLFWFDGAGAQFRYGATVLFTNIANWLTGNLDRVVIGRYFSSAQIGLYATSYNILYSLAAAILGVVQPVFFSASARMSGDTRRAKMAYLGLLALLAPTLLPAFAGLAAVAQTFTTAVYGPRWEGLAVTLAPLALAMPVFVMWGLTTPILWTAGDVTRELRLQAPLAVVWLLVSIAAAQFSVGVVAWSVLALFCLRFGMVFAAAARLLDLRLGEIWRAMRGGALLAAALAAMLFAIDQSLVGEGLPALLCLAVEIVAGMVLALVALRFVPGLVSRDAAPALALLVQRLPAFLARYVQALPLR